MTTVEQASAKYTEKSMLTFLKGEQSEKWILGVLKASTLEDIEKAFKSLSSYANTERFEFLKKICLA